MDKDKPDNSVDVSPAEAITLGRMYSNGQLSVKEFFEKMGWRRYVSSETWEECEKLNRPQDAEKRPVSSYASLAGLSKIKFMRNRRLLKTGLFGLAVKFNISSIEFSLDHLTKYEVDTLVSGEELYDELMVLYSMAHLPSASSGKREVAINGEKGNFYIIDRVLINLPLGFNPFNEQALKKYNRVFLNGDLLAIEDTNAIHWMENKYQLKKEISSFVDKDIFERYDKTRKLNKREQDWVYDHFSKLRGKNICASEYALTVSLNVGDSGCYLGLNMDHLSKDKITSLFNWGTKGLDGELLVLNELAQLPYTILFTMDLDFRVRIVDRILLDLTKSFNPLDKQALKEYCGPVCGLCGQEGWAKYVV